MTPRCLGAVRGAVHGTAAGSAAGARAARAPFATAALCAAFGMLAGAPVAAARAAGEQAAAATAADPIDAVRACRAERDDARRLACFDAASARLGEARVATAAAAVGAVPATNPAEGGVARGEPAATGTAATGTAAAVAQMTPEQRFGFRGEVAREALDRQRAELPELERLTTTVQSASRQASGDFVVTLANGQVWAQLPTGTPQRLKAGDEVTISPAALGSYMLKLPNGRGVRVKRVR